MELGPACADPIIGGVRGRKAAGYDPVYEIDHLRLDHAARLLFHNLICALVAWDFLRNPCPAFLCWLPRRLPKQHRTKSPIQTGFRAHPCFLRGGIVMLSLSPAGV